MMLILIVMVVVVVAEWEKVLIKAVNDIGDVVDELAFDVTGEIVEAKQKLLQ